ncbi:MAG: alanine racemase [Pseudacidovorax sp.]|nr:alanine racemase [Pseudacidovorax sp.]
MNASVAPSRLAPAAADTATLPAYGRPSRAVIDLDALRHNYRLARQRHGGRAFATVKADAYGHGAVPCGQALAGEADGFAVAFLAEAQPLRAAGLTQPILILEGCFSAAELVAAHALGCWVVVHHEAQLRAVEAHPELTGLIVWLKVDSGMHRAGFAPAEVREAHRRLAACPHVAKITLMTHFARADEPDSPATAEQIACFEAATAGLPGERSLANSAGVLAWPAARGDWARPGILLYGADPLPVPDPALRAVMTLESEVFAVRELQPGDPLGYGARFVADAPCRVGLVAVGYADGYPRVVPTGTPVLVGEHASRIVGRVSMDMLTVDLTALPGEDIGSRVELWGPRVPINTVAAAAGTISYELLCHVRRVPRVYGGGAAA